MNSARRETSLDIKASPNEVWSAITDPQQTRRYWYGALNNSTWQPGARWTSESEEGELYLDGQILELDPSRRLVHTMHVVHESIAAAEAPSTVTWELSARADGSTHVELVHVGLGPATLDYVTGGWEYILAGLKASLEQGAGGS